MIDGDTAFIKKLLHHLDIYHFRVKLSLHAHSACNSLAYFRKIVAVLFLFAASGGRAPSHALQAFPRVTLWAWESRQDLREIAPETYAVAYLAETIFITDHVAASARKQPLWVPANTRLIAVVRIEAPSSHAKLAAPEVAQKVATLIVESTHKQQVSGLQIDFDATKSQRSFYRDLIEETRRRMPQGMPLSITALASWCTQSSWLQGLPVDEAVPMLFRMGPDVRQPKEAGWNFQARENACKTSVGVSMDEPWPAIAPHQRIYVFHPRGWNPVALENLEKLITP